MTKKAPGKSHREEISLVKIMQMFPNDATAEQWFIKNRWPDGVHCPVCGSFHVQIGASHKTMPYRCKEKGCRKKFSVKTGTVMQSSNLGYQKWAIAIYLSLTSLKSVSSMKLHRDLEITQKSAWHLAHRIREAFVTNVGALSGPAEADETYFGRLRKNMSKAKRKEIKGRGAVGKAAVIGIKDRETKEVRAEVIPSTDAKSLQSFVRNHAKGGSVVYTDEHGSYVGLASSFTHEPVNHSAGEYVSDMAHTNGIESFWSVLKRAHKGTFPKISPKHLDRYVQEFAGRHNVREADTFDQMAGVASAMAHKRLKYADLVADNGLSSGARGV